MPFATLHYIIIRTSSSPKLLFCPKIYLPCLSQGKADSVLSLSIYFLPRY